MGDRMRVVLLCIVAVGALVSALPTNEETVFLDLAQGSDVDATDATAAQAPVVAQAPVAAQDPTDSTAPAQAPVAAQNPVKSAPASTQTAPVANASQPVANASQPVASASQAVAKTDAHAQMVAAKMQEYTAKIKKFQALKKQKWPQEVTQELAKNLMFVDSLMETSPEEKAIEQKLRSGDHPVEMSLRRRLETARTRLKEKRAVMIAKLKAHKAKLQKKLALFHADRDMKKQLKKYLRQAVSRKLRRQYRKAKFAFRSAHLKEQQAKEDPGYKTFARQHRLHESVTNEADYPKAESTNAESLGEDDRIIIKHLHKEENSEALGHLEDHQGNYDLTIEATKREIASARKTDDNLSKSSLAQLKSVDAALAGVSENQ